MKLLEKACDPAFWQEVKTDKDYAPILAEIKRIYSEEREFPLLPLTEELRNIFYTTGSRIEFETPYFKRRRFLTCAALLALIYPEEEIFLSEAQQVMQEICKEPCWALPAHTGSLQNKDNEIFIDLFAAETGLQLTEICYLLKERLSREVRERAEREVERRIINSFCKTSFWWEKDGSNWAAVCAGNTGACFLYLAPERFAAVRARILSALDCFMSSYPQDGVCLEGFSYWHYGFGEFVWFADLLLQFTDGKTDLLASEKAEKIACYTRRSFLAGNSTLSFSDSSRCEKAETGLAHYLAKRFPKSAPLLPAELTKIAVGNLGWHKLSRLLLFFDATLKEEKLIAKDYFYPAAGQAVINRKKYSLAVKAGHNNEPHNHNDVGSFILATERGQVIADLGAGLYTREYFAPKTRYSVLCNSSRGHSVPIVNKKYQRAGKQFCGALSRKENTVTVDMANAYGQKNFPSLSRRFEFFEDHVQLTDSFSSDYKSLTERFVLLEKPILEEGYAFVGNVKIFYEKTVKPRVRKERHLLHSPENGKREEPVYLLDFVLKKGLPSVSFRFEIL